MSDHDKSNIINLRYGRTNLVRTKNIFPDSVGVFEKKLNRSLYCWLLWWDNDMRLQPEPFVCVSNFRPNIDCDGEEELEEWDELLKIPLSDFIYDASLYFLGMHQTDDGTLAFEDSAAVTEFNATVDHITMYIQSISDRIKRLKIKEGDTYV